MHVRIVESVGEGVSDVKEGDHVIPLFTGECGECRQCRSDKTNLCASLKVDGDRGVMRYDSTTRFSHALTGQPIYHFLNVSSFAEYTVVEAGCVAKINSAAPLDRACLFSCGIPTGMCAVKCRLFIQRVVCLYTLCAVQSCLFIHFVLYDASSF
jgi:Zn-dependent alcohol dehydrogenase